MSLKQVAVEDNKETIKVILPECEVFLLALNTPQNKGVGIKDLRLTENLVGYLESVMPKRPQQPKAIPPKDGVNYTPEETKANTQLMLDIHNQNQALNTQEFEIHLGSFDKGLLKTKMTQCLSFPADPQFRKSILSAAEKVGA